MNYREILAASAALSLAAAPVAAQAATQPSPLRDGAEMAEAESLRGGFIIPLIAIVAIILGVIAATGGSDDDLPHSP